MACKTGDVEGLASTIRDAYIRERRAFETKRLGRESHYRPSAYWDGGDDGIRKGRKNVWHQIARHVLVHGLDPVGFVASQFEGVRFAPQPNMLLGGRAIARYRAWQDRRQSPYQLRLLLRSELAALDVAIQVERMRSPQWSDRECVMAALANPRVAISPLLRYAVAFRMGWNRMVRSTRELALWQYRACPQAYAEAWGDLLPVSMLEEVGDCLSCRRGIVVTEEDEGDGSR